MIQRRLWYVTLGKEAVEQKRFSEHCRDFVNVYSNTLEFSDKRISDLFVFIVSQLLVDNL